MKKKRLNEKELMAPANINSSHKIMTMQDLNPNFLGKDNATDQTSIAKLTAANEKLSNLTEQLALKVQALLDLASNEHNNALAFQETNKALIQENEALKSRNTELSNEIHTIHEQMDTKIKDAITKIVGDKLNIHDAQLDVANQNAHNLQANQELIRQEMNQRIATLDAERRSSENATNQKCDTIQVSDNQKIDLLKEQLEAIKREFSEGFAKSLESTYKLAMSQWYIADCLHNRWSNSNMNWALWKILSDGMKYEKKLCREIEENLLKSQYFTIISPDIIQQIDFFITNRDSGYFYVDNELIEQLKNQKLKLENLLPQTSTNSQSVKASLEEIKVAK